MKPADGNLSNKQILCYGNIFVKPDESKEKRDQQYALRQKIKELNNDEDTGIYRIKSLKMQRNFGIRRMALSSMNSVTI